MVSLIGQTISHYKIIERLGAGGMGEVYKAEDLELKRTVALKLLPPALTLDPEAQERFIHEARAASALDHANICTIHEIGHTDDGQMYIVMACYEGLTLKQRMEESRVGGQGSGFDIDQAMDIAIQVATGLSRAHNAGIVHRDIKPANIMLTTHNEVKILDFGLAKLGGGSILTRTGTTLGTAAYMSPEQARSEQVDERTDIWSLGVVLYEMLTGQKPFESDYEQALVYSILNEEPEPVRTLRPEVPDVVAQIVEKALAKNREERYQTTEEMLSDLRIARGTAETGGTIAAVEAMQRKRRKRLFRRLLLAAGVLGIALVGLFILQPIVKEQALASNPKTILITSFENLTGIDSLDYLEQVLQSQLITSLEQSIYFRPTSWRRMADLKRQLGKGDVKTVDEVLGQELCRLDKAEAMLVGSFTRIGNLFKTTAKLVDATTQRTLLTLEANGRGVESSFEQVDELSRQISRGVGVSEGRTQETLRPVAEISTKSQLAYQLYLRSRQEEMKGYVVEARAFCEKALKEDSLFVSAWRELAEVCQGDDVKLAAHAKKKAISLFSKATGEERLWLALWDTTLRTAVMGRSNVTDLELLRYGAERFPKEKDIVYQLAFELQMRGGQDDQAIEILLRVLELDPNYGLAINGLGYAYAVKGEFDKAIEMMKRYAAISPGDANPYDSMGDIYVSAGKRDEAIVSYLKAGSLKSDWGLSLRKVARMCFLQEDYENALRWNDSVITRTGQLEKAHSLWDRAYCMYWLGRLKDAEFFLHKFEMLYKEIGGRSGVFLQAWIAYERGNYLECRSYLERWISRHRASIYRLENEKLPIADIESEFCLAHVDLREGRLDSVELRLAKMDSIRNRVSDSDSSLVARWISKLHMRASWPVRCELQLARGRAMDVPSVVPQEARNLFEPLYLIGGDDRGWGWGWGGLAHVAIPVHMDGIAMAYVAMGCPDSAIALYERAVTSPRDAWGHAVFPVYHYRLARLYEQRGAKDKAILEYEKFLKIWSKADPIFPEPKDARARLARLKHG